MSNTKYVADNIRREIEIQGVPVKIQDALPDIVGFLLVFDDEDKAREYSLGNPFTIAMGDDNEQKKQTVQRQAIPRQDPVL